MKRRVTIVSVIPSPYQRDLFAALAARPEVELEVIYLQKKAADSPWPAKALAPYERILPGRWLGAGASHRHVNWQIPKLAGAGLVIMNSLMSLTAQWLMRTQLRRQTWVFWGEKLRAQDRSGWRGRLHAQLLAPLRQARAMVGIGSWAERDYRARFPELPHFEIPYHCALEPFLREPRPARTGTITLLFCGQMIARKGLDVLLTAFARLAATAPHARLLLVGREAELPAALAAFPTALRGQVEFAGFQAPDDLPRFFARADVFVLPSRYDGWGVVVNQALGAGLPVLCSDQVGAGWDLVVEERNGLRFRAGEVEALLAAMQRVVREPALIEKWGAASRAAAAEISPTRGAEKWVRVIETVCSPS